MEILENVWKFEDYQQSFMQEFCGKFSEDDLHILYLFLLTYIVRFLIETCMLNDSWRKVAKSVLN